MYVDRSFEFLNSIKTSFQQLINIYQIQIWELIRALELNSGIVLFG